MTRIDSTNACSRCVGRGWMRVEIFKWCRRSPCKEHMQHTYRKRCWLCRGSGRADVITIALRKLKRALHG